MSVRLHLYGMVSSAMPATRKAALLAWEAHDWHEALDEYERTGQWPEGIDAADVAGLVRFGLHSAIVQGVQAGEVGVEL